MRKLRFKRIKNFPKVTRRVQGRDVTEIQFLRQSLCPTITLYRWITMLGGSPHPLPRDISRCPKMFLVVTPPGWGAEETVYYWYLLYLYQGQNTAFKS